MRETECPHCGADLRGDEIAEEHREYYGGATHFLRTIGVVVPGVYDGGLYWRCPDCGGLWNRWSKRSHLHGAAERAMHKERQRGNVER